MVSQARRLERISHKLDQGRPLRASERRQIRRSQGEGLLPGHQTIGARGKKRAARRARQRLSGISIGSKR